LHKFLKKRNLFFEKIPENHLLFICRSATIERNNKKALMETYVMQSAQSEPGMVKARRQRQDGTSLRSCTPNTQFLRQ
jgi:hypothetical protein